MPLTPGLNPAIRQNLPPSDMLEGAAVSEPVVLPDEPGGSVLTIEHDDGSVSVSLDGRPVEEASEAERAADWFRNLIDEIDQGELVLIADELLRGVRDDIESRNDWIEDRAQGIKLLGLKVEIPGLQGATDGAPVEGMSRVRHPLLLEAVLRFQANARSELLPTDGPVKVKNSSLQSPLQTDQLADALEQDLNFYLTDIAKEYYPDTDKMLFMLGFGGTAFKKVYFCPLRNRPVSETVDADDLIVNNAATTLQDAKRVTHRVFMKSSTVKRLQILGVYRDVDLSIPGYDNPDAVQREKAEQQGVAVESRNPEDRDREVYEIYCELDLQGFEHKFKGKITGLEVPYRVTIDVSTREVLSVVRNYDEPQEDGNGLPEARTNFVKYSFVPGLGFYDIGLLHILGNTTNAVTAAWREMLDAGMYANFPGFLMADTGGRQNTNIFRVPPGGGALVKTNGVPISQAVMPLPYKEPGQAMMNLVANMVETGQRVGGTAEVAVGEGRQDAPVGTTIALIDQATKVLNSVHKRMHAAQAEEFSLLVRCFREHPDSFWGRNRTPHYQWDEQTFIQALDNCDLTPQADPNTASSTQRMMKVMALKQLAAANPQMYDPVAVDTAALQALGWGNPEQFFAPPNPNPPMPPEMQAKMAELQIKKQDSDARMMTAQAGVAKVQHEMQGGGVGQPPQLDPNKMVDLELKKHEMQQRMMDAEIKNRDSQNRLRETLIQAHVDQQSTQGEMQRAMLKNQDDRFEAANRQRDRESKERLAAVKLAGEIAKNPESAQYIGKFLPSDMVRRLESNEPPIEESI
jgi:hypothetical protein